MLQDTTATRATADLLREHADGATGEQLVEMSGQASERGDGGEKHGG